MACSLPALDAPQEQLEAAPSLSVVSGASPWLLWQSRQISCAVSGFPKSECPRARVSKVSLELAHQHFCHILWIRGSRGPSIPGAGTQTPIHSGKSGQTVPLFSGCGNGETSDTQETL